MWYVVSSFKACTNVPHSFDPSACPGACASQQASSNAVVKDEPRRGVSAIRPDLHAEYDSIVAGVVPHAAYPKLHKIAWQLSGHQDWAAMHGESQGQNTRGLAAVAAATTSPCCYSSKPATRAGITSPAKASSTAKSDATTATTISCGMADENSPCSNTCSSSDIMISVSHPLGLL